MAHICPPPCDDAVVRAGCGRKPCAARTGRWVLAATIIGSSMAFIDGTVVNVALPVLRRELNASVGETQWIFEAYLLFLAALIMIGGALGDRYGRRRVFAIGVALFAATSVWCGLAANAPQLIAARAAQGIAGALLVPGSLALISATFSERQRGRAFGIWSAVTALTMALGPVLGGWLVDAVSWRWIFFINVPPAIAVVWILYARVPESRDEAGGRALDWPGAALATVGLGAIVFGLVEGAGNGFASPLIISSIIGGLVALALFVLVQARGAAPMMPLHLFESSNFSGANLMTLLLYAGLSGSLFFLPFVLIQVHDYSATGAGAAFLPFIVVMSVLSRWAGGLVDRVGGRLPLLVGPMIAAVGFALFLLPGDSYWTAILPGMTVLGLGMAISVAPLTTVVMGAVEARFAGIASGINNAVSRIAGLLAIAVMGVMVSGAFANGLDRRLATLDIAPETRSAIEAQRANFAGLELPATLSAAEAARLTGLVDDSFLDAFHLIMLVSAGLAVASGAVAGLSIRRQVSLS